MIQGHTRYQRCIKPGVSPLQSGMYQTTKCIQ